MEKQFSERFELFKKENPTWEDHLTDSTYYDIMEWYADKYGFEWDDENGYADEVGDFTTYCWKQICPQAYDTTEYVRVPKKVFTDLIELLTICCDEGNSYAINIAKKYQIEIK